MKIAYIYNIRIVHELVYIYSELYLFEIVFYLKKGIGTV